MAQGDEVKSFVVMNVLLSGLMYMPMIWIVGLAGPDAWFWLWVFLSIFVLIFNVAYPGEWLLLLLLHLHLHLHLSCVRLYFEWVGLMHIYV